MVIKIKLVKNCYENNCKYDKGKDEDSGDNIFCLKKNCLIDSKNILECHEFEITDDTKKKKVKKMIKEGVERMEKRKYKKRKSNIIKEEHSLIKNSNNEKLDILHNIVMNLTVRDIFELGKIVVDYIKDKVEESKEEND